MKRTRKKSHVRPSIIIPKSPTGIRGLDEITGGGLPRGRPTLVIGAAGCGKTLLAIESLVRGARDFGEPGVFMGFEETGQDLADNVASLGFDLHALVAAKKLAIDHVYIARSELEETGAYDLDGLFLRLGHAIDSVGAKRVVLDTVETLFGGLPNPDILRAELRRLFHWLKERGITALITGEPGPNALTRYGIEEYVSDCVILLENRVSDQLSTRQLRVVKYRGSAHGTNVYPFLIDEHGLNVLPVTSLGLNHPVSHERVSTGIPKLDTMLGGKGYYRGSTVLLSGTAGCGKTSLAAHFADATCRRGERCLSFLFEESPGQLMRNMRSIGLDLAPWVKKRRLHFHAARPSLYGLEAHLAVMIKTIIDFKPAVVIADPISSLIASGSEMEVKTMLIRLVDFLKGRGVTTLLLHLTRGGDTPEGTSMDISSLIDTWLLLRDIELNGERNRGLYVLKSRGMAHSHQIRELRLTAHGADLTDVYVGPGGVLTGSTRLAQEAAESTAALDAKQEAERQQRVLRSKRTALESQIAALRAELADAEAEADQQNREAQRRAAHQLRDRETMGRSRSADAGQGGEKTRIR